MLATQIRAFLNNNLCIKGQKALTLKNSTQFLAIICKIRSSSLRLAQQKNEKGNERRKLKRTNEKWDKSSSRLRKKNQRRLPKLQNESF